MIEKVRLSLWDIFTFFLTGLLASLITAVFLLILGFLTPARIFEGILKVPASISLVAAPLAFTLLGMLIEPIANYFDRYVLRYLLGWATTPKSRALEEAILREEICARYLGPLGRKISEPYQLCKDYVEYKQLSTTFMVFLARYGFYRNCAFISTVSGVVAVAVSTSVASSVASLFIALGAAIIFRRRAEEFYSYQAPAVYRAFLIDKIDWTQSSGGAPQ